MKRHSLFQTLSFLTKQQYTSIAEQTIYRTFETCMFQCLCPKIIQSSIPQMK